MYHEVSICMDDWFIILREAYFDVGFLVVNLLHIVPSPQDINKILIY